MILKLPTISFVLFVLIFFPSNAAAQESARSNEVVTQVGNPTDPKPVAKPGTAGTTSTASNQPTISGSTGEGVPMPGSVSSGSRGVFYCQQDPQWANGCNMAGSGCGPTSLAMAITSLGRETITPKEMDAIFQSRKWRGCGGDSAMTTAMQQLLPEKGYTYRILNIRPGGGLDLAQAKEYLDQGYQIIGSTVPHIFVVDGVDITKDTVTLRDPLYCTDGNGAVRPNKTPWQGYGWAYAYAITK